MHGVGDSREKVGGIAGLRQALPPIDHETGQGLQEVILHLDLVPICPCFHGNQHYPGIELFLVHLGPDGRRWGESWRVGVGVGRNKAGGGLQSVLPGSGVQWLVVPSIAHPKDICGW